MISLSGSSRAFWRFEGYKSACCVRSHRYTEHSFCISALVGTRRTTPRPIGNNCTPLRASKGWSTAAHLRFLGDVLGSGSLQPDLPAAARALSSLRSFAAALEYALGRAYTLCLGAFGAKYVDICRAQLKGSRFTPDSAAKTNPRAITRRPSQCNCHAYVEPSFENLRSPNAVR